MDAPEVKYTDIIIYIAGSLALALAIVIVVLCRMQAQPSKQSLEPMAVHKLSKFPLIRQVCNRVLDLPAKVGQKDQSVPL